MNSSSSFLTAPSQLALKEFRSSSLEGEGKMKAKSIKEGSLFDDCI